MIYRTYECLDCHQFFEVTCNSDDGDPDCPTCAKVLDWKPGMFNTKSDVSRAADLTQEILNTDYGLDNFNDNTREGDTVYKAPVETREQREMAKALEDQAKMVKDIPGMMPESTKQQAAGFWAGGSGAAAVPNQIVQSALANAKAPLVGRNGKVLDSGVNPMESLHKMGKQGKLPDNFRIIARG